MARIAGVDLPREKKIEYALMYVYGVGHSVSRSILAESLVDGNIRVNALTEEQISAIRKAVGKRMVEGELRTNVAMDIKRLMDISSYRGQRHRRGLPVRGQRTRTNARTRKGRKKTVGLGKPKVGKKG